MAGMFYSLKEVVEKLKKTESEIKEIVHAGKLREFRDGANLLFKIDEVDALIVKKTAESPAEQAKPEEKPEEEIEISLAAETTQQPAIESEMSEADTVMGEHDLGILEETKNEIKLSSESTSKIEIPEETLKAETTAMPAFTEDLKEKTKGLSASATPAAGEPSLEEIEEDVNLDTFGSGSGLLDLSLQADDTSLGGILDEIYTPAGKNGKEAVAEPSSVMEMPADAEQMLAETPQASLEAAAILPQGYIEPEPDTISNAMGIMMFIPILAVVYTAIVVIASFSSVTPAILEKVRDIIWYIMIGMAVASLAIVGVAYMMSGEKAPKKPKEKKEKPPKVKKEKKAQK